MTKTQKTIIIIAACAKIMLPIIISAMLMIGFIPFYFFIFSIIPDTQSNLPNGYVQTDGHSYAGKDLLEYYWYKYDETPDFNSNFKKVTKENAKEIKTALNVYKEQFWESQYSYENSTLPYTDTEDNKKGILTDLVSENDLFYVKAMNADGKGVPFDYNKQLADPNYFIYFYDGETKTLYYTYIVW